MIFIGKGSSAIEEKSFKVVRAKLCCCWVGCGGLYKLSCHKSLALVKREGEASKAYIGGAYTDRAYIVRAYIDRNYIDEAYIDRAAY